MSDKNKKPEIIFIPGCFDNFEGTPEELEELIAEIKRMADSGELFENVHAVTLDELLGEEIEDLSPEQLGEQLVRMIESGELFEDPRTDTNRTVQLSEILKEFEDNGLGGPRHTLH